MSWVPRPSPAVPVSTPQSFPGLARGLVGISDRVIADHLLLYERYVSELAAIDAARARPTWAAPAIPAGEVQALLDAPVAALPLQIEGPLEEVLAELRNELVARGISWFPGFYLGEADFWAADQATSINVPWYLANETLWRVVNDQDTRYTPADILGILRHETGHALGYAFELWHRSEWARAFGDFRAPYNDTFEIDPTSTDFVRHLHSMPAGANAHYAQKHADEDWAETFAVWLDPGSRWRETYAGWPVALAKLETVELLLTGKGLAYGDPQNTRVGRRVPHTALDYTVGEYLGLGRPGAPDARALALRGASEVYDAVVLHEAYFGGLIRGGAPGPGPAFARLAPGGVDAWASDFRAAAAAAPAGWVLAVWDRRASQIRNVVVTGHDRGVPAGCDVILALDMFEHAYAADVGIRRDIYVGAWWRNIDWKVVEDRIPVREYSTLAGAVYAPPNPDGTRKVCGNCYLFGGGGCAIHDVPVTLESVCGYHLFGAPSLEPIRLPVFKIAPELSGLALVPGGTSCDVCALYTPTAADAGACSLLAGSESGRPPAVVQAKGCCASWRAST